MIRTSDWYDPLERQQLITLQGSRVKDDGKGETSGDEDHGTRFPSFELAATGEKEVRKAVRIA